MKNVIKILVINLVVMVGIFVIAEVGARVYFTIRSCQVGECDRSLFTGCNLFHKMQMVGISTRDPVLGYKPNPNFNGIIHKPPGWDHVYVSIDDKGFRRNTDDNETSQYSGEKILAVGNSFTFGDQVKNSDTWPACLAQKTVLDVWNGGVFGYGAAQAVLRAEQESAKHGPFDIIIWSITVGSDFPRDQLMVRSNFPKPYIATVDGVTKAIPPPKDFDPSPDVLWLLGYSVILKTKLLPIIEKTGNFSYDGTYKIPGENAAEIEEIINFAFQRFADLTETKRKSVLLQYGSGVVLKGGLERRNGERNLVKKYGEKYHIDIIDSFDQIYVPEKKNELWFDIVNNDHHTPYGNQLVCDIVLNWLTKKSPDQRNAQAGDTSFVGSSNFKIESGKAGQLSIGSIK